MDKVHTEEEKILAVLHDCIEDEVCTIEELRQSGFSESILDDLKLLTHDHKDDYLSVYIKNIATSVRATNVKKADLEDNSNITRMKDVTKKDFDRLEKYHLAYRYLSKLK